MDKMSEKSLRITIVVLLISLIYLTIMSSNKNEEFKQQKIVINELNSRVDSIKKVSDSLYDLNFPCQIELGRFQVAYQIFLRKNPNAAMEFGDIISNETE